MPLQISHLALGFLTTSSLRTSLSFVFENTAAAGGFVSGWEEPPGDQMYFVCCRHTKHCSETRGCSCSSGSLPVTTCLRALFRQDHSLPRSCFVRLCLCPCFMTSLKLFFNRSFLKVLITWPGEQVLGRSSFVHFLHTSQGSLVTVKSLCSGVRLRPHLTAVWPDSLEPQSHFCQVGAVISTASGFSE